MRTALSILAPIICLLHGFAVADEQVDSSPKNEASAVDPPTPDHLVPIDPYPGDWHIAYTKQLTKHLGLGEVYFARMIVMPSFGPEYSMRVHGDAKSYAIESSNEFFVTCTISDESIWYSMSPHSSEKIQKPIKPKSYTASIPAETARKVSALWDEMILRTHYPREEGGLVDGITIEFASPRGHGEACSPNDGTSPALLQGIGEGLIAYCKANAGERMKLLDSVHASVSQLEAYLIKQAARGGAGPATPTPKSTTEGDGNSKTESKELPR